MIKFTKKGRGFSNTLYGIWFGNHPPRYKKIFKKNPILKDLRDQERTLSCILLMEESLIKVSHYNKPYVNLETREICSFKDVKKSYNFLDWECAFCKTPIKVEINNYKRKNFSCDKCFKYYLEGRDYVSQIIVDSTLKFTEHYKTLLRGEQKKFLKYIKKNDAL